MKGKTCPKCQKRKFYRVRRRKLRCRNCSYEFKPKWVKGFNLSRYQWKKLIEWFLLERSSLWTAKRTGLGKNLVYRAFRKIRLTCLGDKPEGFSGIVEVDETYLGGQWKNKRKSVKRKEKPSKKGRGTTKQPVLGILCRSGMVWAELVSNIEAPDLIPIITKRVKRGTKICSDTWRAYTGLAAKGYVHRLVKHQEGEYSDYKGHHINGLEGFWGYLKRKLASKGGIRKEYLNLYLAEYVWRYNHRGLEFDQQIKRLLKLINEN